MTREQMLELAEKNTSNDNIEKMKKMAKKYFRVYSKDEHNEYILARDTIVMLYLMLYEVSDLDNLRLTVSQRDDLAELIGDLFTESEVTSDE